MSEQPLLNVSSDHGLGKVEIAPSVIEVITSIAATEVDGLVTLRGNFASDMVERFGKKAYGKGVKVELTASGISIDLYVVLQFRVSIPKIAQKLQRHLRQTIKDMLALETTEINIHVVGVQIENQTKQVNEKP